MLFEHEPLLTSYRRCARSSEPAIALQIKSPTASALNDGLRQVCAVEVSTLLTGVGEPTLLDRPDRLVILRDETLVILTALERLPRAREA